MAEVTQTTFYLAAPTLAEKEIYAAGNSLDIYFGNQNSSSTTEKKLEDLDQLRFVHYQGRNFKVEGLLKHMVGESIGAVWMYVVPCAV